MARTQRRSACGLLSILSFSPSETDAFYTAKNWNDDEIEALFGVKEQTSGEVPTYDYLGRYPLLQDINSDIEYFDATSSADGQEEENGLEERSRIILYTRIPRSVTSAQSQNLSTTYTDAIDFPPDGTNVLLVTPKRHLKPCPFYIDGSSIVEEEVEINKPFTTTISATIIEVYVPNGRRATGSATLRVPSLLDRISLLNLYKERAAIKGGIADFIVNAKDVVGPKEFLTLLQVLETEYKVR